MRSVVMGLALVLLSGCGLAYTRQCDPPQGAFKHCHHTLSYETEPLCVGSCNPQVKSW